MVSFLDPVDNSPVVASMRVVVDVGERKNDRFVVPGGQKSKNGKWLSRNHTMVVY